MKLLSPTSRPAAGLVPFAAARPAAAQVSIVGLSKVAAGLVSHPGRMDLDGEPRRAKIWDLSATFHCSIVGTCLTTGELRSLVRKFRPGAVPNPTDHDLHTMAVGAIARRDLLAKQIQKTLDRSHAGAIASFAKARTGDDLLHLWAEALKAGDVPGAYWAALTHPAATDITVRRIFGDVHMLSHLVGAANRADIRRLHRLEEEKAALEDRLTRQQASFQEGVVTRDARIRDLTDALAARVVREFSAAEEKPSPETSALSALVADLRKRLDLETHRRERAEEHLAVAAKSRAGADQVRVAMEQELRQLRAEMDAVETALSAAQDASGPMPRLNLSGRTILYVGGQTHHVARLKSMVAQAGGELLHHDGGIEQRTDLLPGLVSRADAAYFPVDRISHPAAQLVKRACRQAQKPCVPLRASGLSSLLYALMSPAAT
jgi:Uncharacterized protein conserved in bacteria (DUF2325)